MDLQKSSQSTWDSRYIHMAQKGIEPNPDPWLSRWRQVLATGQPILDLGCGSGLDSRALLESGLKPLAFDFSRQALVATGQRAPEAPRVQADLRGGLPLRPYSCGLILANLVLHYFPWGQTLTIVDDLNSALRPGGKLLCRLNSTDDVNFGARGNPQLEPGLYLVDGLPKRFFDRDAIERLFAEGWHLDAVHPHKTQRSGKEKHLWEVLAKKTGLPAK